MIGSKSITFSLSTWLQGRLTIELISQNIATNQSVYNAKIYISRTNYETFRYWNASPSLYTTISGPGYNSTKNQAYDWNIGPDWVSVREETIILTHNADGTPPSSTFYGAITDSVQGWNSGSPTPSLTYTFPTIPRYAAITAFTASINDRSASVSWTADKTISQWRLSWDSGSTYPSNWMTVNATSGSTGFSVSPGSTYGVRIQVKDSVSGLITTSGVLSRTATKTPSTLSFDTTSQNIGSGIKWTINESYDYTHQITYSFHTSSGYILGSNGVMSNTSTGTWTIPTSFANHFPNATSSWGTIYLYTYYGGVHIGTKSYTFTAKIPNNTTWQPTVPNVTISHVGNRPTGSTSYVQTKSQAKVVSNSTAQGGASISSYRVIVSDIGTYYGSNITSGFLTKSGTVTITVRATDSRGYYRDKSSTITVAAYSPPTLITYTAARGPDEEGTNLVANINFSISPIGDKNTKLYRIRYREIDGEWKNLVSSDVYYTRNATHSATGVLDENISYEIEFYIADYYTLVTRTVIVGTAFTLMDFHKNGRAMAIGKVSEGNGFEVGMPTTIFTTLANILKLKRSSPHANVNLVFENDVQTRYISFKETGRPAWASVADVSGQGYDFWTNENATYGSNSNGQYVRFPNGVQICWRNYLIYNVLVTNPNGALYGTANNYDWTFPATFSENPSASGMSTLSSGGYSFPVASVVNSPSTIGFQIVSPLSGTIPVVRVALTAVGRWK